MKVYAPDTFLPIGHDSISLKNSAKLASFPEDAEFLVLIPGEGFASPFLPKVHFHQCTLFWCGPLNLVCPSIFSTSTSACTYMEVRSDQSTPAPSATNCPHSIEWQIIKSDGGAVGCVRHSPVGSLDWILVQGFNIGIHELGVSVSFLTMTLVLAAQHLGNKLMLMSYLTCISVYLITQVCLWARKKMVLWITRSQNQFIYEPIRVKFASSNHFYRFP
jgi:hypothetical protein